MSMKTFKKTSRINAIAADRAIIIILFKDVIFSKTYPHVEKNTINARINTGFKKLMSPMPSQISPKNRYMMINIHAMINVYKQIVSNGTSKSDKKSLPLKKSLYR